MNRMLLLLLLIVVVAGCGSKQHAAPSGQETLTHEFSQDGLELKAALKIGKEMKVNATITNTSDETIMYNGRCGIPFGVSVKKDDASAHLVARGEKEVECESIFDPKDLREMKPNASFTKEVAFQREFRFSNGRNVGALSGVYEVSFSFQVHDGERFHTSIPIELTMEEASEILTVDQAKALAKENLDVKKWFDEHDQAEFSIRSEDAILGDGIWAVMFHAIHKDEASADRIIIHVDAKSGVVQRVHHEEVWEEALDFLGE